MKIDRLAVEAKETVATEALFRLVALGIFVAPLSFGASLPVTTPACRSDMRRNQYFNAERTLLLYGIPF